MTTRILIILFIAISTLGVFGQNTWTFVSAPNLHAGEREVSLPVDSIQIEQQLNAINDMKRCNHELLLIDGDLAAGPRVGKKSSISLELNLHQTKNLMDKVFCKC